MSNASHFKLRLQLRLIHRHGDSVAQGLIIQAIANGLHVDRRTHTAVQKFLESAIRDERLHVIVSATGFNFRQRRNPAPSVDRIETLKRLMLKWSNQPVIEAHSERFPISRRPDGCQELVDRDTLRKTTV